MNEINLHSKYRGKVIVKVTLWVLLFLAFFGLKILDKASHSDFVLFPLMISLTIFLIQKKTLYSKLIIVYVISVALSCLYSYFYNHQSLLLVVVHSYNFFSLLFFFYLMRVKPTAAEAEKVLITVAVICCCCYILQWMIYPTISLFFSIDEWMGATDGRYRARIPGSISCYCLLMYGINKYTLTREKKYLCPLVLGFIPIIVMGFRTLVFLTAVAAFIIIPFITRNLRRTALYSMLGVAFVVAILQTNLVQSKLEEMLDRQENEQTFENDEYIRYREFDYYWNEYFTKPGEKFFGGGVPVDMSTKYRRDVYYNDYAFSDLGMVGCSMIIGMPAVFVLVLLYIICIWRNTEPEFQYLRFTLLIVLLGSVFTTTEMFRDGNILLLSIILYIEYIHHVPSDTVVKENSFKVIMPGKSPFMKKRIT